VVSDGPVLDLGKIEEAAGHGRDLFLRDAREQGTAEDREAVIDVVPCLVQKDEPADGRLSLEPFIRSANSRTLCFAADQPPSTGSWFPRRKKTFQ
jgi:hypothetical protein